MSKRLRDVSVMLLVGGMMWAIAPVYANDITINIIGEIVVPPCLVNNGGTIDVDFGDVSVTDVANARNMRTLNVPVSCMYYLGTPYVKVSGTQLSGAANNILATNVSNFGLALYQGDSTSVPMALGNGTLNGNAGFIGYPVQSGMSGVNAASGTFTFTVLPYKQGTGFPAAGAFSASASMSISYQ